MNEVPQQTIDETHTSCPSPLPWLSSAQRINPGEIHVDEISLAEFEGNFPKHTIDLLLIWF